MLDNVSRKSESSISVSNYGPSSKRIEKGPRVPKYIDDAFQRELRNQDDNLSYSIYKDVMPVHQTIKY